MERRLSHIFHGQFGEIIELTFEGGVSCPLIYHQGDALATSTLNVGRLSSKGPTSSSLDIHRRCSTFYGKSRSSLGPRRLLHVEQVGVVVTFRCLDEFS